jgi:hypothetical protein
MKPNNKLSRKPGFRAFSAPRRDCQDRWLRQIGQVKGALQEEFAPAVEGYEPLLRLALNEAEAIAWQTRYPQLLFPTLAREKAAEVRRWAFHQRALQRKPVGMAFAA